MQTATSKKYLPGDLPKQKLIDRIIRVDQAGEYGAQRIYEGQLAVLKSKPAAPIIREMHAQEKKHLDAFNNMIPERGVRPTALQPLWHVGGWLMGAGTALLGEKAAMACTVAVESVIGEHYARQHALLPEEEAELKSTIAAFRDEELEHHDTGLAHGAEQSPFYKLLSASVKRATKTAIWLSERV